MKPVTILGGGLAGLSLGIALRTRGVPVVIHESTRYPRHRVCGEFISGIEDSDLDQLGILGDLADARILMTTSWRNREGNEICRFNLPDAARGISRHRLDLRLAKRFEACGGELVIGRTSMP